MIRPGFEHCKHCSTLPNPTSPCLTIRMGTLNDITSQANNTTKRQPYPSIAPQTMRSPEGKENLGNSRSPHFMTPTFSSSKQSIAVADENYDRAVTPASIKPTKAESSGTFIKSAARRVGLHRMGDGTPRSKKEGPSKASKGIIFPDKVRLSRIMAESVLTSHIACYGIILQMSRLSTNTSKADPESITTRQTSSNSSRKSGNRSWAA